jgi:hypothetical protein
MVMIKKIIFVGLGLVIIGLVFSLLCNTIKKQQKEISILINNNNAYQLELLDNQNKFGVYILSLEQIRYSKDSVINSLDSVRKELGIKDKQLNSMTGFTTYLTDTFTQIIFKDTVIKELCNFSLNHSFNKHTSIEAFMNNGIFGATIDIKDNFYLYYTQDNR